MTDVKIGKTEEHGCSKGCISERREGQSRR